MPEVQLTASIADIFTFPALRQSILNRIDDIVTLSAGLAVSGAGLGASIAQLPGTVVTVTQQILTGQFEAALTTIENYLRGAGVAIIGPTLAAIIERRERNVAVVLALQTAVPTAIIQLGGGFLTAIDGIARAAIQGGTIVAGAVLDGNFGNLVGALVQGTGVFLQSFVPAGQAVIDGTVAAQQTLAQALATQPTTVTMAAAFSANASSAEVTDVPDLSRKTAMVAVSPPTDTTDTTDTADALIADTAAVS